MKRETATPTYVWKAFNPSYGPWYRLRTIDDKSIVGGEAVCMPDMDGGRWYWFVRTGPQNKPLHRVGGHEPDLDSAKRKARAKFDRLYQTGGLVFDEDEEEG